MLPWEWPVHLTPQRQALVSHHVQQGLSSYSCPTDPQLQVMIQIYEVMVAITFQNTTLINSVGSYYDNITLLHWKQEFS